MHMHDEATSPELTVYLVDKMNEACKLNLIKPTFVEVSAKNKKGYLISCYKSKCHCEERSNLFNNQIASGKNLRNDIIYVSFIFPAW